MNAFNETACSVCGLTTDGKLRCNVISCEACKRFFLRQRNTHELLTCSHHHNEERTAKRSESGAIWRYICPKCRYDKCLAVGMTAKRSFRKRKQTKRESTDSSESKYRKTDDDSKTCSTSSPSESRASSILVQTPSNSDFQEIEQNACTVMAASSSLESNLAKLRASNEISVIHSSSDAVNAVSRFDSLALVMKDYVQMLPGYSKICGKDLCVLFANCFAKFTTAESGFRSINGDTEAGAFNMSSSNAGAVMSFLPELSYLQQEMKEVSHIFKNWQPSNLDMAFLYAFLFYDDALKQQLAKPGDLDEALKQLQFAYDLCQRQHGSSSSSSNRNNYGSADEQERRAKTLSNVMTVLRCVQQRRYETYARLTNRAPQVAAKKSQLFAEIVNKAAQKH